MAVDDGLKIREWVRTAPDASFRSLVNAVEERLGTSVAPNVNVKDKFEQAIRTMKQDDFQRLLVKSPTLIVRVMEWLEKSREADLTRDMVINLVPYEVDDKRIETILLKCDDNMFKRYAACVDARRKNGLIPDESGDPVLEALVEV